MMPTLFCLLLTVAPVQDAEPTTKPAKVRLHRLERQVLRWMEGKQSRVPKRLAQAYRELEPGVRKDLAVSVHGDSVSWRWRGTFPREAMSMLEYIVSSQEKDYESLLVVRDDELARLRRFVQAYNQLRENHPETRFQYQLVWSDAGQAHFQDLRQILMNETPERVDQFMKSLRGNDSGIGAINLTGEKAALPLTETAATLVITIRPQE